jgi:hypothetical protein
MAGSNGRARSAPVRQAEGGGAIRATPLTFRIGQFAVPEELGNAGRVQWVSGRPGEAPAYAGTDFIIARDGRIAAVYLLFDKLP